MSGRSAAAAAVLVGALGALGPHSLGAQGFPPTPPRPTRLHPTHFPAFQETTLPGGTTLVVIARSEEPTLSVTLSFRAGGIYDPPHKEGVAALAAALVTKGTTTRSAEEIAAAIEGVGGSLSASSDEDFLTVSVDALSDQLELVFELLGDVTRHCTFPPSEFELARTRALSGLALELSEPDALADRAFAAEIYGRNPYGRRATRESYQAITRDDVAAFATERLRPAGALLVVAGDVTEPRVRELAAQAFAGWHGAPPAGRPLAAPPVKPATDILLVHRAGSAQANIVLGNSTIGPTDPIYYAGRVVTQVLGGGSDARLFSILREERGWTYGAYAALVRHRGLGYWQATAEVRPAVADSALSELLRQVERVRAEPVSGAELAAAKGFLVGSFPRTIETAAQIATQVATAKLLGLGDDYLRLYRDRLEAVTARDAQAAAARLYRPDVGTIVVVGDATQLQRPLAAIAPVRVVDAGGRPLGPADLAPRAPPGAIALDTAQFAPHRDSSRVVASGAVVGFVVSEVRRSGDSLVYEERSTLGNGAVVQQTIAVLNPADGAVRRVDQVITQHGQRAETHLVYDGAHVTGESAAPQADGSVKRYAVDTVLPPGTVDENAVPFVVPAARLEPGRSFALNVFTPSENVLKVLSFQVTGPDSVTVPAGTFRAYRVVGSGSRNPFVMVVTSDAPRRVLKTEYPGQAFAVELVK